MPTPDPHTLLNALRAGGPAAVAARTQLAAQPDPSGTDPHAAPRAQVALTLLQTLAPTDHLIAVWLLQQEVAAHHAAGRGASDALVALAAAVARFGQPSDALVLWQAYAATPDTRDTVDVEHLGRAGVERVRAWLLSKASEPGWAASDAEAALAWLEAGQAAGAFDALADYFAWSDEAIGLTTGAPV
jgi:hypothetical protein